MTDNQPTRTPLSMLRILRILTTAILLGAFAAPGGASDIQKVDRLLDLHDLRTTVAIGNYYIKQEAVLAARGYLRSLGREQGLGDGWNRDDPHWQQAEAALVNTLTGQAGRPFTNLEWLMGEWGELTRRDFSDADLDFLAAHLRTEYGRKQVMIMDHNLALYVMASYSMTGKMQDVPGTERERKLMQDLWEAEDTAMRFDINDSPESTQFAFSPAGKKYFVNAVLKVSGIINARINQSVADLPALVQANAVQVRPYVDAFRQARGG
jgi:hypothetical protein